MTLCVGLLCCLYEYICTRLWGIPRLLSIGYRGLCYWGRGVGSWRWLFTSI